MDLISDISIGPMPESQFLKPLRLEFTQNGNRRYWDFVKIHASVSSIIFNKSRNVLVFVKQFRPAVFYNGGVSAGAPAQSSTKKEKTEWSKVDPHLGITLELCAGIVDKSKSLQEIVCEEILEECGYKVPLECIEELITYRSGIGVSGDMQTLYYTEVTDEMKVSSGGGNIDEGELILVVELTIQELRDYISRKSIASPGGFLYAMTWFLHNKAPQFEKE